MDNLEKSKNNEVLKEILNDSFGGVMYNQANKNKYYVKELLDLWANLSESEKDSCDGCINGAINFIKPNNEKD